ncbi:MAG: hypothetical protein IKZ34_02120 [Alphaproteobacteria bacterium]|nr:hypothetical protein [Alphaproteobacteria bacterium]
MKKISMIALLATVAFPVFAEEPVATEEAKSTDVVAEVAAAEETNVTEAPVVEKTVAEKTVAEAKGVEEPVAKKSKSSFLHGLQIGAGVSATSGLNGFVGYVNKDFNSFWAKRFGVRFDFGTTSPVKTVLNDTLNDVLGDDGVELGDYLSISDVDLKAHHYAAMLDFYPFGNTWFLGGWRLTGGYYMGELQATANVSGVINEMDGGSYEFELGGRQFKYVGSSVHGTAKLDWEYRGPYVGTGFDFGLLAGFKIYVDAGVVFTNKAAQLSLDVPFENLKMLESGTWETVQGDTTLEGIVDGVVADTLADAQSELDDLKFYPMVKVGFMYRF